MKNVKNDDRFEFPLIGYIIIGVNALVGIIFLSTTIRSLLNDGHSLFTAIFSTSILLPYTLLFLFILIYIIDMHINSLRKPKEETLCVYNTKSHTAILLDKKGRKYHFASSNCKLYKDEFYKVLKTRDEIKVILEKTDPSFEIPEIKENFWLTWHVPFFGPIKDLMILPILYAIFLMGICSSLIGDLGMIFLTILTGFLILYDLYFKFLVKQKRDTMKNETSEEIEQIEKHISNRLEPKVAKMENIADTIERTFALLVLSAFIIFLIVFLVYVPTHIGETEDIASSIIVVIIIIIFLIFLIKAWLGIIKDFRHKR